MPMQPEMVAGRAYVIVSELADFLFWSLGRPTEIDLSESPHSGRSLKEQLTQRLRWELLERERTVSMLRDAMASRKFDRRTNQRHPIEASSVTAPAALAPRSGGMESDEERAAPDRTDAIVGGWQAYEEAELPRLRGLSMSRPWRLAGPALRNATLDLGSRSKWVFFTCVLGDTLAFKRASPYSWLCLTPEQTDADAFAADVVKAVIDSRLSGPP